MFEALTNSATRIANPFRGNGYSGPPLTEIEFRFPQQFTPWPITPSFLQISLEAASFGPDFFINGSPVPYLRTGPSTWVLELPKLHTIKTPVQGEGAIPGSEELVDSDQPARSLPTVWVEGHEGTLEAIEARLVSKKPTPIYLYDIFIKQFRAVSPSLQARNKQARRRSVFLEIDLIFLFHRLDKLTPDESAYEHQIERIAAHFRDHCIEALVVEFLKETSKETLAEASKQLMIRSKTRAGYWACGVNSLPAATWESLCLTPSQGLKLARILAAIFRHNLYPNRVPNRFLRELTRCVLLFASGGLRFPQDPTMVNGKPVHSTECTAEPNGDMFRAFAEFSDVAIEELAKLPEYKSDLQMWEEMKPALVLGIELLQKVYQVYPMTYGTMSHSVTSKNLARLLDAGIDPRPDRDDIEKAIGRTEFLANRTAFQSKVPPLGSFWGAICWNFDLNSKSSGALKCTHTPTCIPQVHNPEA
ncbi:MAG: hypothetical protein ACI9X4_000933 [Glaciecola sp.]|jgi:hypothetical protein